MPEATTEKSAGVEVGYGANAPYRGTITREQFRLREARIVARLRLDEGLTLDEVVARATGENLFQYPTERECASIARASWRRLDALSDDGLRDVVAHGLPEQAAQAHLYALMRDNRLVWDFMTQLVADKYRTLDYSLTTQETMAFINDLAQTSETVASWTDATRKRVRAALTQCLTAGGLQRLRDPELLRVYLDSEVRAGIVRNGDADALPAFDDMTEE